MMAETERLCEYCSAIDFEQLRLPSSRDVQKLNEGQTIEPLFPPVIRYYDAAPTWSLGSQSRVERSAATCSFCREVSRVVETSGVRVTTPSVFEKDPICDVYFTESGSVLAPPGVTWKRCSKNLISKLPFNHERQWHQTWSDRLPYWRVSLRWTTPDHHGKAPVYRRLDPEVVELCECFQSIEAGVNERRNLFSGRERSPLIKPEQPRRWLHDCLENHNDCSVLKSKNEGVKLSVLRLIDTKAKAVVEFLQHRLGDTSYVTLSYVWGTTQQLMLKRENLFQLQSAGSLSGLTPQTITDAMSFTSDMGYRYLWADVLCIIQDDDADKSSQIQIMGDIYKHSVVTIVAAAGHTSNAGLPGIRTPRTAVQHKVQVEPASTQQAPLWLMSTVMPLSGTTDPFPYTYHLPWHTRGWTLQEKVLSRRVFTFTGEQLLWSCRQSQRWEETDTETELASLNWYSMDDADLRLHTDPGHIAEGNLWTLVHNFSRRELCFDGDAYDAFSAILREYEEMNDEQFVWGMPVSEGRFDSALCWVSFDTIVRRQGLTTLPTTPLETRVPFPSWSWLGWKGKIGPNWNLTTDVRYVFTCYAIALRP